MEERGVEEGVDERRQGTAATSSGGGDKLFCQHLPCNWLLPARVDVLGGGEGAELIGKGVIGPRPWHRPGPMTHWSRAMARPGTDDTQ